MTLPVALLHGFSGNPESWAHVRAGLGTGVEIVAPALVGHGPEAETLHVTGFESEVDRVAARLRPAGRRFHLVGYSLGGRVALGLLLRHPDLIATATLIGAQPGLDAEAERTARRDADARLSLILEERGIEAFVDTWERAPLFESQRGLPADVIARQRAARLARDPKGLARSLRLTGLAAMPSYWDALTDVETPTTLVVGGLDEKFLAIARRMAERLPRARLEVIPGAGHNVVLERPDAVVRVVSAELEGSP